MREVFLKNKVSLTTMPRYCSCWFYGNTWLHKSYMALSLWDNSHITHLPDSIFLLRSSHKADKCSVKALNSQEVIYRDGIIESLTDVINSQKNSSNSSSNGNASDAYYFLLCRKKILDIQYGSYQTRPPIWYVRCYNRMLLLSSLEVTSLLASIWVYFSIGRNSCSGHLSTKMFSALMRIKNKKLLKYTTITSRARWKDAKQ